MRIRLMQPKRKHFEVFGERYRVVSDVYAKILTRFTTHRLPLGLCPSISGSSREIIGEAGKPASPPKMFLSGKHTDYDAEFRQPPLCPCSCLCVCLALSMYVSVSLSRFLAPGSSLSSSPSLLSVMHKLAEIESVNCESKNQIRGGTMCMPAEYGGVGGPEARPKKQKVHPKKVYLWRDTNRKRRASSLAWIQLLDFRYLPWLNPCCGLALGSSMSHCSGT